MTTTKTLTPHDKETLNEIYNNLKDVKLKRTYQPKADRGHCVRIGSHIQEKGRSDIFGNYYFRGKIKESKQNKKNPKVLELLQKFLNEHNPTFPFHGVYVNMNTVSQKHIDSGNQIESLIVGCGEYEGGETIVYTDDVPTAYDIKNESIIFNGSKLYHDSKPFEGFRISLVFFKNYKF
jgi:hypothetical protein